MKYLTPEHEFRDNIEILKPNNYKPYMGCRTVETPNSILTAFTFIGAGTTSVVAGWGQSAIYRNGIRVMTTQYTDSGAAIEFSVAPTSTQVIRGDVWVLST